MRSSADWSPAAVLQKKLILPFLLLAGSFAFLYQHVIAKLVHDWWIDENYSHGFLIVPLALYFAWERRDRFNAAARQPSILGLVLVIGSLGALVAGVLGAEVFTSEISLLGVLAGVLWYLFGFARLQIMIFPLAFLLLMIPIPAIIFNQITFPLQLLASRFGEMALVVSGIPVLREGNVIQLANTSLEVAEACSGIRSLISLLTLGIVYGYFMDRRIWARVLLAFSTIPVAIVANGVRVAGTGIAAHYYGPEAAQGFFHTFSGWLVFLAAFLMLSLLHRIIIMILPRKTTADSNSIAEKQEQK
jgi:exosortase